MFDVEWSDPHRETVGERNARKKREKAQREQDDVNSGRASVSTQSSSSSTDKPFNFFKFGTKKNSRANKNRNTATSALGRVPSVSLRSSGVLVPSSTTSTGFSAAASAAASATITPVSPVPTTVPGAIYQSGIFHKVPQAAEEAWEEPGDRSSKESASSKLPESSGTHPSPIASLATPFVAPGTKVVQILGPNSFIIRTVETITSFRKDTDPDTLVSSVTIVADPADPATPTTPVSPLIGDPIIFPTSRWLDSIAEAPGAESNTVHNQAAGEASPVISPALFPRVKTAPPVTPLGQGRGKAPQHVFSTPPVWPTRFKANNPDAWKPPEAWDCSAPSKPTKGKPTETGQSAEEIPNLMAQNLESMLREIKTMQAASPQIMLMRLKEEWGESKDASVYKELELNKKRWMLAALDALRPVQFDGQKEKELQRKKSGAAIMLALFESQATTSYLAAVHPKATIYHVSTAPLSHSLFPNVHPHMAPSVSHQALTLAPGFFTEIRCLSLPSVVPSSEIPQILRQARRCLATNGVLHLTLVDPMPVAMSLGPKMRSWMEDNLLINLERSFRCQSPWKLFPSWLTEAHLRGDGSAITTLMFRAVLTGSKEANGTESMSRTELRSTVGRMLWQEIWGTYVTGARWWWQDPECVEECSRIGTYWELHIIEAVRSDPPVRAAPAHQRKA